jgi:pantothenate kinase
MVTGVQRVEWSDTGFGDLVERAGSLLEADGRRILGIAGAPASGKSTLAIQLHARLAQQHPGKVALLGMDGFHLAQRVIDRRGQAAIKGAPQTFDGLGYLHLLERIRNTAETVYAPEFDRGIEDSIAAAVEIGPEVSLIITEGNYLLLDDDPWRAVADLLDESWYVHLEESVRLERLLHRHLSFGHPLEDAQARTHGSDQRNAELINERLLTPDVWVEHLVTDSVDHVH